MQRTTARREVVFQVVSEGRRWHEWSGVPRSTLERFGEGSPNGVGSIRRLGYPPLLGSREEVVAYEEPRRLAYVILSGGLPVRHYHSEITLEEADGGGTVISWRGHFEPLVPGTGRVTEALVTRIISGFARRAAAHAERLSSAGA